MTAPEINELLNLKAWTKRTLAAKLQVTEDAVYRWIDGSRNPNGPATTLMRHWLEQARKDSAESVPA